MLPPKGAKGALVAASSQKQGKTGWLFGLCVIMAFLVLIAGCEEKAPKRQSTPRMRARNRAHAGYGRAKKPAGSRASAGLSSRGGQPRSTRKIPVGFVLKRFIVVRLQLAPSGKRREQAYQLRSS